MARKDLNQNAAFEVVDGFIWRARCINQPNPKSQIFHMHSDIINFIQIYICMYFRVSFGDFIWRAQCIIQPNPDYFSLMQMLWAHQREQDTIKQDVTNRQVPTMEVDKK